MTQRSPHKHHNLGIYLPVLLTVVGLVALAVMAAADTNVQYNYDNAFQLVKASYNNLGTIHYTYDNMGNRVSMSVYSTVFFMLTLPYTCNIFTL